MLSTSVEPLSDSAWISLAVMRASGLRKAAMISAMQPAAISTVQASIASM